MEKEKLKKLKALIEKEREFSVEIAEKRKQFEESIKDNTTILSDIRKEVDEIKTEVRSQAIEEYIATGNKKLMGGIGIRVLTKLDYAEEQAFEWSKQHQLCLKLDKSGFEKIAKTQDIPFVTKREESIVTFPSDIKIEEGE